MPALMDVGAAISLAYEAGMAYLTSASYKIYFSAQINVLTDSMFKWPLHF